MRAIRHVPVVLLAVGTVACTALLGDYDVGATNDPGNTDGGEAGAGEGGLVTITPTETKVGVLRGLAFTASVPVTWSIQEGAAGGTIDDAGKYVAPDKPGVVHVIATAKDDPTQKATATVTVAPLGITVVAGANGGDGNIDGPALRAHFRQPAGIAHITGNGGGDRYYIADTGNHTIREYDEQQNKVTTIAGKPGETGIADGVGSAARFNNPTALVTDRAGKKLYIVDSRNDCIRVLDIATKNVRTFTGTCGTPGSSDGGGGVLASFSGIRSISLNGGKFDNQAATAMYVCDANGSTMRRVDLAGASAGLAKTLFATSGCDVATDLFSGGQQDKYVYYNSAVGLRRFKENSPGNIEIVASTPVTSAGGMYLATGYGGQSELVVTSPSDAVAYRYRLSQTMFDAAPLVGVVGESRVVDGPLAAARLGRPQGVDIVNESSGAILIADTQASAIRRVDTNKGAVSTFIGAASIVERVDGPRATARFTGPFGIAADDTGNLYVADVVLDGGDVNNTIRKVDVNGAVTSLAGKPAKLGPAGIPENGPGNQATFGLPSDLVFLKGSLYVTDLFGNAVRKIDAATGAVTTLAGELGVSGTGDGIGAAAHFTFFKQGGGDSFLGSGITTDGTDLYVADAGNFSIRKIAIATGQVTTIAGGTKGTANGIGAAAQFMLPFGLTYEGGSLYIADALDHTIRRLDLKTNEVTGFIGLSGQPGTKDGDAGNALFKNPSRILGDGLGNLYVVELPFEDNAFTGQIRRIDIKARSVGPYAGQPGMYGLATGPLPSTVNCPLAFTRTPQGDLAFADFCEASIGVIKPL